MAKRKKPKKNKKFEIDSVWETHPEVIKKFLDCRTDYEQLCIEVAYILEKKAKAVGVEIALVAHRAKSLNSFLEKVQRKKYSDPFVEIEDFAGVRLVCLYVSDLTKIEEVIKNEFEVISKIDKLNEKGPNEFGYGAVHYILRLGGKSLGARYDDLRELKCEVQVRTVLQDAWAIIDHHLVYKRETDIPRPVQRKLNGLAGLFETADNQFDQVRQERQSYVNDLSENVKDEPAFLSTEVNLDSLAAYLKWRFPNVQLDWYGDIDRLLIDIDKKKYPKLKDLDRKIADILPHVDKVAAGLPYRRRADSAALRMAMLLALIDLDFRKNEHVPPEWERWYETILRDLNLKSA